MTPVITYPANPSLKMTYRQWLTYRFDPLDLIIACTAVDGSKFCQAHPSGISIFCMSALSENPAEFNPQPDHDFSEAKYIASAFFRIDSRLESSQFRIQAIKQLASKFFIRREFREEMAYMSPSDKWEWYLRTPFTISPCHNSEDCHRNYEALICKSIPIILGADASLQLKYSQLPVRFVDTYDLLSPGLLRDWYAETLDTVYDFNYLSKSYWVARRPDVRMTFQSLFWLKRCGALNHVRRYIQTIITGTDGEDDQFV